MKIQRHKHSKWKWRVTMDSGTDMALFRAYSEAKEYSEKCWGEPETPKVYQKQKMPKHEVFCADVDIHADKNEILNTGFSKINAKVESVTMTIHNPSQRQIQNLRDWAKEQFKITVDTES